MDLRLKGERHQDLDGKQHQHQRPGVGDPARRHSEARQITRHEVQHAGDSGSAGEPEDQDSGDIVDGTHDRAHHAVRQIGQDPSGGRPALFVRLRGDEEGADNAGGQQQHAHDQRRGSQHLVGVSDPSVRDRCLRVPGFTFHQRHDRDSGLEAAETQGELRKSQARGQEQRGPVALDGEGGLPVREDSRVAVDFNEPPRDHHEVQQNIRHADGNGQADRLTEAAQKDTRQQGEQHQRDPQLGAVQILLHQGVLDDMLGRVGCRQGDSDDEGGAGESEQHEDEELAPPARQ